MRETKLSIIFIAALILFFLGFWLIFHSSYLANLNQIISLRNKYFDKIEELTVSNIFLYSVRPLRARYGDWGVIYDYKFIGKFISFNYQDNKIIVKDQVGRIWQFNYTTIPYEQNADYRLLEFNEETINEKGEIESDIKNTAIGPETPNKTGGYFKENDIIAIFWADKRKLGNILKARKTGEMFKTGGSGVVPITIVR